MLVPTRCSVTGEIALTRPVIGTFSSSPSSPNSRSIAPAASALNVDATGNRPLARYATSRPVAVSSA
jgi:hypothetical protein